MSTTFCRMSLAHAHSPQPAHSQSVTQTGRCHPSRLASSRLDSSYRYPEDYAANLQADRGQISQYFPYRRQILRRLGQQAAGHPR